MGQAIGEVLGEEGKEGGDGAHQGADGAVVEKHTPLKQDQLKQDQDVAAENSHRVRHEDACRGEEAMGHSGVTVNFKTFFVIRGGGGMGKRKKKR